MVSLKIANSTVGEQITVEQLIEKRIVMTISRHDYVYRHHVRRLTFGPLLVIDRR